ncbi:hypothetical protein CFH99_16070 [Nocardioides aromaticivorans]|uniref:Uncharacterized protein n=1 Tax=Nocardioides aromaticivorans TaxID=200618 RepID=A0ABX7PN64_9ACTN|nr:hypothetical protein [Nocardioides aromaticivorans]QSR27137.1 hypothetical protein CFH99_16070 [Nocardioides aromaticivorans]
MSDDEKPAPQGAPEQVPPPVPAAEPVAAAEPVPAAGPVPTKVRWRERAFTLRSLVAVALAGVVIGAGAGVATTLLVDDDHGDGPGRHWMDGPGRGGFPGPGGPGRGDRPDFVPPGQQPGQQQGQPQDQQQDDQSPSTS